MKEQKVIASDGAPDAWFGSWVALDGSTAFVSAKNATIGANAGQGAVYVFSRSGGIWKQVQKLTASDGGAADSFGNAIAVSGNIAMISAPNASVDGRTWQGAVYVFSLLAGSWKQVAKLAPTNPQAFDNFGVSIALDGNFAFIGAGGAHQGDSVVARKVFVFKRSPAAPLGGWHQTEEIATPLPSDPGSFFGASIAVSGSTCLIGARAASINGNAGQGEVHIYLNHAGAWTHSAVLRATDGDARDNFGVSIGYDGVNALIGAPGTAIDGNVSEGAAYHFKLDAGHWIEKQRFSASDGAAINLFGAALSLSGNSVLVGAYAAENYKGAAYIFTNKSGSWKQVTELIATDGHSGDVFGYYVALDAATALIGSYTAAIGGDAKRGAGYFYSRITTNN